MSTNQHEASKQNLNVNPNDPAPAAPDGPDAGHVAVPVAVPPKETASEKMPSFGRPIEAGDGPGSAHMPTADSKPGGGSPGPAQNESNPEERRRREEAERTRATNQGRDASGRLNPASPKPEDRIPSVTDLGRKPV